MKNKKKADENHQLVRRHRPWDALPSLALWNIVRNLNFKDRFGSIPYVCKSWNSIISNDPLYWSSMVPESISPDDAFIKKPDYSVQAFIPSKLFNRRGLWLPNIRTGLSHLITLIKKSSPRGSSSTITSLYLDPFHFAYPNHESHDHNVILHLIAHCCPNLKHNSFDGFYCASIEAVLEVFHKCKKIELIDFSDSGYADSVEVIKELGNCLPNLRGIRMAGWKRYSIHDAIATHLPRIKLLAMECYDAKVEDFRKLTSETECCLYELQYLSVGLYCIIGPPPVCTHIPEFHYEEHRYDWEENCRNCQPLHPVPVHRPSPRYRSICYDCWSGLENESEEKDKEEYNFSVSKYFYFDEEYHSILKQTKEGEYYLSISKEKKKKTRRKHRTRMTKNKKEASFILKMKMRKKKDKYDYQDYNYVQAAF